MRWLLVTPEYPPHASGGIAKYYQVLTEAWREAGAEVTVLVSTPFSSFEPYQHDGVDVHVVPGDAVDRHAGELPHLSGAPEYRRWIAAGLAASDWVTARSDAFDAIETADFGLLFAPLLALRNRPPLVVKMHGSVGQIGLHEPPSPAKALDGALARLTEAALLPAAESLVAYSPANAREWQARLDRPVGFVPPPLPLPNPRSRTSGPFDGVAVGRIQSWKGPEVLCQALRLVQGSRPGLRVAWIGRDTSSGPQGASMSAWLAETYPDVWGTTILPIGPRTPDEVADLQRGARFVAVPSLWDTFNYTLAEAMGLGCVVLGSSGAGASYLIEHGETGFRFDAGDAHALADVIEQTAALPEAGRTRVGAAAREVIAAHLDPREIARQSIAAAEEMVGKPRAPLPISWITDFFQRQPDSAAHLDHLENISIRDLAGHLGDRVLRKVLR